MAVIAWFTGNHGHQVAAPVVYDHLTIYPMEAILCEAFIGHLGVYVWFYFFAEPMFSWFRFTPESIPVIVELILAVTIAVYLFSIKNKSYVLWLLAISLIGESFHQLVRLVAFSVPALFQSATPLLGVTSIFIFFLLVRFAYYYRIRLYPREDRVVGMGLGISSLAISTYLVYLFASARPHDQMPSSRIMLYVTLSFLLLTAAWASVVMLRKVWHFKTVQDGPEAEANRKAVRACFAFAGIFSLKILIILASLFSEIELISEGARIYASLVLHIIYLSSLTVVIIDHLQHSTSLQMKLVGLSLASVLLILSIGGLSVYSTESLLERTRLFIPKEQTTTFQLNRAGEYEAETVAFDAEPVEGELNHFGSRENVEVRLVNPVSFFGVARDRIFVNRHGLIAFDQPYQLASEPQFHLEQLSVPYKSKLHWKVFQGPAIIAALHLEAASTEEAAFVVEQSADHTTITWINFTAASDAEFERSGPVSTFGIRLHPDGQVDINHKTVEAYLYEGLVGIHPGGGASSIDFSPALYTPVDQRASTSFSSGLVFNLSKHFRLFVHQEVLPLLWLIIGSLFFVLLIFPVALRASILGPLNHLLEGAQRINKGRLDQHVPVVAQDEIGNVANGFNSMMDSLKEAHQKLVRHADQLEEEVALRTDEIRQQKDVLEEQAVRLKEVDEMKSRFFGNISHDFRTPLNLIMGPLQSILDGDFGPLDARLKHRHEVMLDESKRLLKLINQLLDLSKMEVGRMALSLESVDLVNLWKRMTHSFSSRAEMEQKTLTFHCNPDVLTGLVDPERMEQIGYNLIDNALKFTDAGGKVRVSILSESEHIAAITVQDTGCGIPKEQQAFIFDRFHQVDNNRVHKSEGTGIGLALVQELVLLHEGTIEVHSEPGFGTTFTLRLPVDPALHPDKLDRRVLLNTGSRPEEEGTIHKEKLQEEEETSTEFQYVLIVDDDAEFRHFLKEYLGTLYSVVEAENGEEGLKMARQNAPALIVSDLMMPEMDGVAFCRAIRQDSGLDHTPFILLTAKASVESRIEGLEHGADAYLNKPVDPRELRTRIQNLLDQRRRLIEKYTDMVRLGPGEIMVESADAQMLQRIIEIIEDRLDDAAFSVTLLADEMGMSVRDLQRKLKHMLDVGPKELITRMRVEQAKQLLAGRAGTVSQIAYKVGFSRPEYFMRIFKQHTGMTPGQYMKGSA